MRLLQHLLDNNRNWASRMEAEQPGFFNRLVQLQTPQFLWIGCSDSRVPANEITGLLPGEIFVHRNIANIVSHADGNCLSVLQYAVEVLKVRHVLVVGHYRCGGVKAALERERRQGPLGGWLRPLEGLIDRHREHLGRELGEHVRWDRLCELNVLDQVSSTSRTRIVRDAWARGQELAIHGWIYHLHDGHLTDLNATVTSPQECETVFAKALTGVIRGTGRPAVAGGATR
jgi:carbonic anhydrase